MTHLAGGMLLGSLLIWSTLAGAHSAKHSGPVKPLHGGQSLAAGPYHLELVAKDGELLLYVTDHSDRAIATDGAKAKATIRHGYETATLQVELEPSGENTLRGTGEFTMNPDTGIIVFFKLPDQQAYAAQFMPLKPETQPGHRAQKNASGQ